MHTSSTQIDSQDHSATRWPWSVLVLVCVAQFMVILDITVVNVALPSIGADLGFAAGDLQWVVTAYVLFTGGLLLLGGRASDLLGRRPVFLAGLLVFTAASLASGLAASPAALIISRAAQGLGAAMLSPAALSILTTIYTGPRRTRALSVWGAIGAGGAVVGLLFGGMLTTWLSWEWVFFINVPVGIATALFALRLIPPSEGAGGLRELDLPGASTLVGGLVTLIYGIEGTTTHGWGSTRTLGLFALATVLLGAFLAFERAAGRPLIPTPTWGRRTLTAAMTMMLGATGFLIGLIFLGSLYLQQTLGASALATGFAFLPIMLAIGPVAHIAPALLTRFGTRTVLVTGLVLMASAAALLSSAPDQASYAIDLLPGLLIAGVGIGLVFVTVNVTAMSDVGPETAGLASGLMTTSHEVGAALGVSVFSAVAAGAGGGAVDALGSPASFGEGTMVAALIAAGLAIAATAAVPVVRPASTAHVGVH